MKVKELIELMSFISESELNEVKLETDEMKLSVKKSVEVETRFVEQAPQMLHAQPQLAMSHAPAPVAPSAPSEVPVAVSVASDNHVIVKSPMIGTFYRSANPESPSFAEVGDKITVGQTVCIVEAMKLFNEIESEVSGTIVKVLVENSTPVEFDQPLFVVDPS